MSARCPTPIVGSGLSKPNRGRVCGRPIRGFIFPGEGRCGFHLGDGERLRTALARRGEKIAHRPIVILDDGSVRLLEADDIITARDEARILDVVRRGAVRTTARAAVEAIRDMRSLRGLVPEPEERTEHEQKPERDEGSDADAGWAWVDDDDGFTEHAANDVPR